MATLPMHSKVVAMDATHPEATTQLLPGPDDRPDGRGGHRDAGHAGAGAPGRRPARTVLATTGWTLHWVLRVAVAIELLVYGWSKVFLMQMGRADFSDALVNYGEMSPMGLLWRFVGYSPLFQVLSGCAEVLGAVLLLWRRTVWLGALVAMFDMGFVFILNMAYDVPVKQLSLGLAVASGIIALPFVPRLLRILTGRAVPAATVPRVFPWPKIDRITRWIGALFAIAIVAVSAMGFAQRANTIPADNSLPGTYRVTKDVQPPAPQLAKDTRWQQVAIGQWKPSGSQRVSLRQANGDLRRGKIRVTGPNTLELELIPVQRGAVTSADWKSTEKLPLNYQIDADGSIHLVGAGQDLTLTSDPETRFLFDREFQWAARPPVNR